MPNTFYPITGIQEGRGPNGEVPVKMEVDDWWESKDPIHLNQHTLLFTALNKMYDASPHDKLSYFQIAGIHNQPIVSWDDTPFENKNYCKHSGPNFPTWHRPYNVLLEQRLHEVMVNDIIPQFPESEQADLKKAADLWRFPFWDWATKKPDESGEYDYDIPDLIKVKEVEVRVPGGKARIPNPFWQFEMRNGLSMGDEKSKPDVVTTEPYTRSKGTSRHPYVEGTDPKSAYVHDDHAKGIQNNDQVKEELQGWKWKHGGVLSGNLRDWFYRVLLIVPYVAFADNKADPELKQDAGSYPSLEDIHDDLHTLGGGSFGHMGAPSVGAFDPLFWLHHNNVDRTLDIWAALHPQEARDWLNKDPDSKEELIPFREPSGKYYTAHTVWHPEHFGYTYPETKRWEAKYKTDGKFDETKLAAELTQYINKKYNSAAAAQRKAALTKTREAPAQGTITSPEVAANAKAPKLNAQIIGKAVEGAKISTIPLGKKIEEVLPKVIKAADYVANVEYEKFALDGHPFTIRFFIGKVPDGHHNVISQALTHVGEIYNFVDPVEFDKPNCENCAKQMRERTVLTGQVPLTNALLTRFKQQIPHETPSGETMILQGMDPEHVVPFLRANFNWRVTDSAGKVIDNSRITGMKVSVATGNAEHHTDVTKLSSFKDFKILYDITADADSGTGAHPNDNLFSHNPALSILGIA